LLLSDEREKQTKDIGSKQQQHAARRSFRTEENAEIHFTGLCAAVSSVWPMDTLFPVQAALFMHNLLKLPFLRRKSSSYLISPVGVEPSKWQKDNVESVSTCLHLFFCAN
jgi:hypothetical protein